ncbi:MAG TPA: hypothetical protein PK440_08425 [Candidatus Accumulibacter phosphatis]|nr:hypothetical protein [Candidatus Accumulibacter phosphatis]HRQ95009.1 hypothetical protein [Candidatus Accumulibacter phosphatis]
MGDLTTMPSPSADFESQLELFRTEAQSALQFFFAWDAIHAVAAKDKAVFRLLNEAPLFWNTALGALQGSALVALGRVFDPDPDNHSVTRLLALAHANLDIFCKDALAARKRKLSANADEWLPEYLATVYVPSREDFRTLKRHVAIRRKLYEEKYRPLRHKVFAHRGVTTREQVGELFAKTNLKELRQLLVFLGRLYSALWNLYFNGHKPRLRPARYSVQRMLEQPSPNAQHANLQERLVHEAQDFLSRHSKDAQPTHTPDSQRRASPAAAVR